MKKLLSLLILPTLMYYSIIAQNNDLVIFAEEATPFYIVMNGIKQNETAETNVKIPNIKNDRVSVKVIFEDKNIAPVSKNISFYSMSDDLDEAFASNEIITYRIVRSKKGFKIKWHDQVSKSNAPKVNNQTTVVYKTVESSPPPPPTKTVVQETVTTTTTNNPNNANVNMNMGGAGVNMSVNVSDNTNQTTQQTNSDNVSFSMNVNINDNTQYQDNANVSMNVNVNDNTQYQENANINMNMNVNDNWDDDAWEEDAWEEAENIDMNMNMNVNDGMDMGSNVETSSYSSTTTTTTTTTSWGDNTYSESTTTTGNGNWGGNSNNYASDCQVKNIHTVLDAVENETFKSDKMMVAKQATKNKCLSVDQIKLVMDKFTFEDNKLEFAKNAYINCTNKDEYYRVNESFTFSSSKSELNEYLSNH